MIIVKIMAIKKCITELRLESIIVNNENSLLLHTYINSITVYITPFQLLTYNSDTSVPSISSIHF